MATNHIIGKVNGQGSEAWSLDVFVFDDGNPAAAIDVDDVITYLGTVFDIPVEIAGIPDDGNPQTRQISNSLWQITIRYNLPTLRPLHPPVTGQERLEFNCNARRRFVRWAPEVNVYGDALTAGGLVNVVKNGTGVLETGVWIEPPVANLRKRLAVSPATITPTFVRTLASLIESHHGASVNSVSLQGGAYAAGEIMLVSAIGFQSSNTDFQLELGWSWKQNVTGETRESITGIAYDGHDFVWEWTGPRLDRLNVIISTQIRSVFVNQVSPRADLSVIGILPP
jgi:hypothetical protein